MALSTSIIVNARDWNALPAELLRRSIHWMPIVARLRSERVSPRWSRIIWKLGWTDLQKLDCNIVSFGATSYQIHRFTGEHLISLLNRVGPTLIELDLVASFGLARFKQFVPQIAVSLKVCSKLEKLNIRGFDLADFLDFLRSTLRQVEFSGDLSVQTLKALAFRCPKLEEVPFNRVKGINLGTVNEYIEKFLRLKTLRLNMGSSSEDGITQLWYLKQLEVLEVVSFGKRFDEQAAEAMSANCQRLRKLSVLGLSPLGDALLHHFSELPNLTVLELNNANGFSDDMLKRIAARGQLKEKLHEVPKTGPKLKLHNGGTDLTDDAVIFLVRRCKSLVSLDLLGYPLVTNRTLEAVVSEVNRRHGSRPSALPSGPEDTRIFYFKGWFNGISIFWLYVFSNHNPWLLTNVDDSRDII